MIDNPPFYLRTSSVNAPIIASDLRTESNRTLIHLPVAKAVMVIIQYDDVGAGREVTPRFLSRDNEIPLIDGTPGEAAGDIHSYLLGHDQFVPRGEMMRVTGKIDSPGHIRDGEIDLRVEMRDIINDAYGFSGNSPIQVGAFILEMIHESASPVSYQAIATLGT